MCMIITARIRRMGKVIVSVCLSVHTRRVEGVPRPRWVPPGQGRYPSPLARLGRGGGVPQGRYPPAPARSKQTNKMKTLPFRRAMYAGGKMGKSRCASVTKAYFTSGLFYLVSSGDYPSPNSKVAIFN